MVEDMVNKSIHAQRVTDEMIFQYMIKRKELEDLKVKDIKNIARTIGTITRNALNSFNKSEIPRFACDDDIANDPKWICKKLKHDYMEDAESD